ncbi:MAG: hypothetical protein EB051_05705 [Chlamydiia bacterium]|nr:hypothetical protein [Chlamydiia bacterium]
MTPDVNTADTYSMKKGAQLSNWVLLKVTEGPFKGNEIETEGFGARFELGLHHYVEGRYVVDIRPVGIWGGLWNFDKKDC